MKIHLDTDIGGDVDDLCALAFLLKLPDVKITGITTTAEENGRRAGYTRHVLDLVGRADIPLAAGAEVADGYYRYERLGYPDEIRNWGQNITPRPNPLDDALDLLKQSIEQDAVIIAIGPLTNLRLLEEKYHGILQSANLFMMGGYIYPVPAGFPQWGNNDDWNNQVDIQSAKYVLNHATPTLIPLTVTAQTFVSRSQLPALEKADVLGQLLARQLTYFAEVNANEASYGKTCTNLPDDFINFQHDPLACALAVGWDEGITMETVTLQIDISEGYLYEQITENGKPTRIVTQVDGQIFADYWLNTVCSS